MPEAITIMFSKRTSVVNEFGLTLVGLRGPGGVYLVKMFTGAHRKRGLLEEEQ